MLTVKLKNTITTVVIVGMLLSLMVSRAMLSITTVLFAILPFIFNYQHFLSHLKKSKHLFFVAIPLVVLLVGFIHSNNQQEWAQLFIMKLPLLLLAIGFVGFQLNNLQQFIVNQLFIFIVLGGTFYTIATYYLDPVYYENQYHYAKVLPTLMDKDHIRFSWCVNIALLLVIHSHFEIIKKSHKVVNFIIGIWLFVFLHILGSKTGILFGYLILASYFFLQIKHWKIKLLLLLGILMMPFIAYQIMPTFKNRVNYLQYDYSFYSKGQFIEGLSDGARVLSIKGGIALAQQNQIIGIGYGDIKNEMERWYKIEKPTIKEYENILPSSQYIMTYAGAGILGLFILMGGLLVPLIKRNKKTTIYFYLFYSTVLFFFLFEIPLESQFGVFIFAFFSLWFLHLTKPTKIAV